MMRNDLACLKSRATPAAVTAWVDLEPRYVKAPIAAAPALTDPGEPQYGPADIAELPWLTRPIRCAALTPLRLHPARQRPQPVGPPAQYTVDRTEHALIASHGRDGVVQRPADSACSSYPHPIHRIRCAIHLLHPGPTVVDRVGRDLATAVDRWTGRAYPRSAGGLPEPC